MWYSEAGKQLADEDIIVEKCNGLREDGVVMIEGGGDNPVVEDGVGKDID